MSTQTHRSSGILAERAGYFEVPGAHFTLCFTGWKNRLLVTACRSLRVRTT